MAYKFGTFVWHEVHSNDVDKSLAYYSEVLGWKSSEMDMGGGNKYLMLSTQDDKMQMGILKSPMEGTPPHFAQYLSVEDVDGMAKKVEDAGGKVLVPGTDIPVGRFAVVADPQGAAFALFKAKESDDNGSSAFQWNELWSPDAKAVLPFYEKVFGVSVESMEMPGMKEPYHMLKKGEALMGGAMTSPMEGVPAMWLPYIGVDDVDATIERAKARGGEVVAPAQDVPNVGRFAVVKEPEGAVVGVITPEAK
jgi:predicted enzyme related to lactoylglutathione lyase